MSGTQFFFNSSKMAFRRSTRILSQSSFWDSASDWAIKVSGYRKYGT